MLLNLFKSLLFAILILVAVASFIPANSAPSALPNRVELNSGWILQDTSKITDPGSAVSQEDYKATSWYKATVPGTILTTLVNNQVYPEPLYGENNRPDQIPDSLCRTAYWYRAEFQIPSSYANRFIQLNFDGINYKAEVWLNGHNLGAINGAFARGTFDITSFANRSGINTLAVKILPPPDPGVPNEHTIANGTGHNGGVLSADGPTFMCTVGWDWIPGIRDRDMGIWQGVYLSAHGPVTATNTNVTSDLKMPGLDSANLTVDTTLTNTTNQAKSGVIVGSFGSTSFRCPVSLAANESRIVELNPKTVPQLHVNHPKLWWPNGYGSPNLYAMKLQFIIDGTISDSHTTSFGIRKITYSLPGSDNLAISVNGVPVFCKGGDWGFDEAMKREPYARLDAQIRYHRDANYTIIRNWVGQSTSEDFYDLCDKYGIMVWDEMFQPNPGDGPNPNDNDLYLANVREKLLRFRSHPCIILWCGRNEGHPPPAIDTSIIQMTKELDPDRLYQSSSGDGRGVRSSGPYYWREPAKFYDFGEAFKTETGSVSIPTLESVEAMMPKKDWNTVDDDWAEHDLANGASGGPSYVQKIAQRYGSIYNLADFVRKGQMANYEAFRAMYEGRNAKLFNPCTGVITWMSNPAQPSFVWQIYSWDLEAMSSFYAAREACEPVHIQLNQNNWHVMVINNTPNIIGNLTAKVSIYNMDGTLKSTNSVRLSAVPSAATDGGEVAFPESLSPVHFVKLQLTDSNNRLISDNFYWRETEQNNFTDLQKMPTVSLSGALKSREADGRIGLSITLVNRSKTPALLTHVQVRNAKTLKRVLPVFYSDNYLSLLPGVSKTITADCLESDLDGAKPIVFIDGWNASVNKNADFMPNIDALTVTGTAQSRHDTVKINCGGSGNGGFYTFSEYESSGAFGSDRYFVGGNVHIYTDAVKTNGQSNAPQSVYQSERWGECTYSIPVPRQKQYTVKLHFAENSFDHAGARRFNVDINNKRVLSDFDIYSTAGGKNIAVDEDFLNIEPGTDGNIAIHLTSGSVDQPSINGIEILPEEAK